MLVTIPGKGSLTVSNLVLDFNGTIAVDGIIVKEIKEKIIQLSKLVDIYVITADTNGTVFEQCSGLPVTVHIIGKENQHLEKKNFILQLQEKGTISIGNGSNDSEMFTVSDIAIAIVGEEGCATSALLKSDIVVTNIVDAFDMLLKENRLIATLRS